MTARMNISLPDELKNRMDTAPQPINWSGVAAQAFRNHLEELEPVQTPSGAGLSMEEAVQRLLSSRENYERDLYGAGLGAGMAWARTSAEWIDLERLESICGEVDEAQWAEDEGIASECHDFLLAEGPAIFGARHSAASVAPARYVHGFCDGALSILEEVRKHV